MSWRHKMPRRLSQFSPLALLGFAPLGSGAKAKECLLLVLLGSVAEGLYGDEYIPTSMDNLPVPPCCEECYCDQCALEPNKYVWANCLNENQINPVFECQCQENNSTSPQGPGWLFCWEDIGHPMSRLVPVPARSPSPGPGPSPSGGIGQSPSGVSSPSPSDGPGSSPGSDSGSSPTPSGEPSPSPSSQTPNESPSEEPARSPSGGEPKVCPDNCGPCEGCSADTNFQCAPDVALTSNCEIEGKSGICNKGVCQVCPDSCGPCESCSADTNFQCAPDVTSASKCEIDGKPGICTKGVCQGCPGSCGPCESCSVDTNFQCTVDVTSTSKCEIDGKPGICTKGICQGCPETCGPCESCSPDTKFQCAPDATSTSKCEFDNGKTGICQKGVCQECVDDSQCTTCSICKENKCAPANNGTACKRQLGTESIAGFCTAPSADGKPGSCVDCVSSIQCGNYCVTCNATNQCQTQPRPICAPISGTQSVSSTGTVVAGWQLPLDALPIPLLYWLVQVYENNVVVPGWEFPGKSFKDLPYTTNSTSKMAIYSLDTGVPVVHNYYYRWNLTGYFPSPAPWYTSLRGPVMPSTMLALVATGQWGPQLITINAYDTIPQSVGLAVSDSRTIVTKWATPTRYVSGSLPDIVGFGFRIFANQTLIPGWDWKNFTNVPAYTTSGTSSLYQLDTGIPVVPWMGYSFYMFAMLRGVCGVSKVPCFSGQQVSVAAGQNGPRLLP